METMSVFFEYLFCLIDVLLLDKLCSINFECKRSPLLKAFIFLLAGLFIMIISSIDSSINYLLNFFVLYIFIDILYEDKNRKVLIPFVFVFYTIYGLLTMFFLSIISLVTFSNIEYFLLTSSIQRIIYVLLSRLIMYIILIIYGKKKNKTVNVSLFESSYLIFFFISCLSLLISLYDVVMRRDNELLITDIVLLMISIVIMITCLFKLVVSYINTKMENAEYKHKLYLKEIKQKYYLKSAEQNAEIIKIKHDMKNHFISLGFLLEAGKIEEAILYLSNLSSNSSLKKSQYSDNLILNALLNNKVTKNQDIKFEIAIDIGNIKVSDIDLSILLGNSLDNAIEAVKKLKKDDRKIFIEIKQQKTILYFKIVNKAKNIKMNKNNELITNKKDKSFHNIGMKNMIQVAKKYNGDLNYNFTNNVFTLEIFLFI
ncbi:ATP-binding protein [bacterium c-19]|nr:ATP-binding protein [bacterium c-19]